MSIKVTPLATRYDCTLGASVSGIALHALSAADWAVVEQAFHQHALLIFPGQHLEPAAQEAFARRFGEIEILVKGKQSIAISNRDERGQGVLADLSDVPLRLGSFAWLRESGISCATGEAFHDTWTVQGSTVLGLAHGADLLAVFALRDTLKPHAAEVVAQLLRQGQKVFLVTGDNPRTAAAIAQAAGIPPENVFAEIRPEEKSTLVGKLQQRGERVAFVGDGINDAPALEQADLGIAVSQASDVARESADLILLNADIQAVPEALGLAQATLRTIKQNLFWAFFYNAAAIPLAALGFLSPVLCAAAMGLSDLVVLGNALRLRHWRR